MIAEEPTTTTAGAKAAAIPFRIKKLGHVVYYVSDMERTVKFYTEILPLKVSDVNEQGMVFLRYGADHHTIAFASRPGACSPRTNT
jgi:catechol 2,3-dioxygenase-like lactoylglutathione lyase family enzyme